VNAEALSALSDHGNYQNKSPYRSEKSEHSRSIVIIVCHTALHIARLFAACAPCGGIFRCPRRVAAGRQEMNFGVEACP